jgi:hypothetical protein
VAADTSLTYEEQRATLALAQAGAARDVEFDLREAFGVYHHPEAVLAVATAVAVGVVVKTAVETAIEERRQRAERPALPRATARQRRARPVAPKAAPAKTSEPALPPADKPRFLK